MPIENMPNQFLHEAAELLQKGTSVKVRVGGNSMLPFLRDGKEVIELIPLRGEEELVRGAVVFFRYNGQYIIHRLIGRTPDGLYLLQGDGNLKGCERASRADIYGILHRIYLPGGSVRHCDSFGWKITSLLWYLCRPVRRYLLAIYRRLIF